jgi:PAS domain S-box-containing protein
MYGPMTNDRRDLRHFVQFYESDDFLLDSVAGFLGAGLRAGEGIVVIARQDYRERLEARFKTEGFDIAALRRSEQYLDADAAATLSRFAEDGWPSEHLFKGVVEPLVFRAARDGQKVRAFGEMVALLWEAGRLPAAIRLEQYWEDLTRSGIVSLFCAYPVATSHGRVLDAALTEICRNHSHVVPAESYVSLGGEDERTRAIVLLQQKARALEAEIAKRKELELSLYRRERELSDLFENGVECLHKVSADGMILWANRAELTLLGYSEAEYLGRNIRDFHVDREVADEMLERLLRAETLRNFPVRLRAKDGAIKYALVHSNGLWENGALKHTRCFSREVSEDLLARVRSEPASEAQQQA